MTQDKISATTFLSCLLSQQAKIPWSRKLLLNCGVKGSLRPRSGQPRPLPATSSLHRLGQICLCPRPAHTSISSCTHSAAWCVLSPLEHRVVGVVVPPDRQWEELYGEKSSKPATSSPLSSSPQEGLLHVYVFLFCFSYGQDHSQGPKPCGSGPRCPGCCGEEEERCDPGRPGTFLGCLSADTGSWALLQPHGLPGQEGAET